MKSAILHLEAEAELVAALDYYAEQRVGLDGEMRHEFEAALTRVRENPLAYAAEDEDGIRYCPLRRFPYTLVFVELADFIWVAAVAHQHRRPGYWLARRPK
ncbi:MAG: type II toxin-antitoxin system RelE/ParE family toxin [Gemmataceae bacterium]